VADAGAGIDIVVAEARAHQLLDQIGFLVGAAARGDAAERLPYSAWMLELGAVKAIASSQLTSRHGSVMLIADHRLQDAVLVVA
jgi:hypothetical protein